MTQQQQFFSRRTGSQKEGTILPTPSTGYPLYYNNNQQQQNPPPPGYNSNDTYLSLDNVNQSPVNGSQIQKHINHLDLIPQVHKVNQQQDPAESHPMKSID